MHFYLLLTLVFPERRGPQVPQVMLDPQEKQGYRANLDRMGIKASLVMMVALAIRVKVLLVSLVLLVPLVTQVNQVNLALQAHRVFKVNQVFQELMLEVLKVLKVTKVHKALKAAMDMELLEA
jgi:hypothetical protein